jgi:hypothetical protein
MPSSLADPITIKPDAIYDGPALRMLLGITSATLTRARRNGALRSRRIGKQTVYLGRWVLDWIASPMEPAECTTR